MIAQNPANIYKKKLHLLLHLPQQVRRFGPPTTFSNESFEAKNASLRYQAVHSSRHSPSKELSINMANLSAARLLLRNVSWKETYGVWHKPGKLTASVGINLLGVNTDTYTKTGKFEEARL